MYSRFYYQLPLKSGDIDSEGDDTDNAKMSGYSGECHFSIKKCKKRVIMNPVKGPMNVLQGNTVSDRGRTFASQSILTWGVYDSMTQ